MTSVISNIDSYRALVRVKSVESTPLIMIGLIMMLWIIVIPLYFY